MIPDKQAVLSVYERVRPYIHRTPVLTSHLLEEKYGCELYFKCENFQKMGAFKMRGATNAILQLTDKQRSRGVVTHSSGNFAQALSLAAKSLNIKAYIVMPENAPTVKQEAVKTYGGIITLCASTIEAREQTTNQIQASTGASLIHPSNDTQVILGQGTAALELLEEYSNIDNLVVPVGGGGLLAGTCIAAHYHNPKINVYGSEPVGADDAKRSLEAGKIAKPIDPSTIADGLRTHLGDYNFPVIKKFTKDIILIDDEEILAALKDIWQYLKIVVEPSSAVPLAAIKKEKELFAGSKTGIVLSGGNVDLKNLPF